MAGVKKSLIWSFYSAGEDSRYAICKTCAQSVSRGRKNTKTFNTSNLAQHLKSKHQDDYKEFEKHIALKAEQQTRPMSLVRLLSDSCHWEGVVSAFDCGISTIVVPRVYTGGSAR